MLILPIVNRNRILNVHVSLKPAEKIRTSIRFPGVKESEIFINGRKFSESNSSKSKDKNATIDFIRSSSLLYQRNFLVTTRQVIDSNLYDVYELPQPPKKINDAFDSLYDAIITDIRKEIPGIKRGRYLSFAKLGLDEEITEEKIDIVKRIVSDVRDSSQWPVLFERAGVADLLQMLEFMNNFDCTVVSDTTVKEEDLCNIINSLEPLNTRESRNLISYYKMALGNRDIYAKLSYLNKILYGRPLSLIQSESQKQKQLVKTNNEGEYRNVA